MAKEAILNAISALDEKLTKRLDEIEDKLSKRVDKLETSIQFTQSEVDEVKKRIDSEEKEIKSARKLCDQSNNIARELLNQVEDLERRSRKYNVRIKSKEKFYKADNYIEVAAGIMLEKKVAPPGMFCWRPVRNSVVLRAKNMLNSQKDSYRIVEDMIKGDFDKKRRAFPLIAKEFKDGKKVRFTKRRSFINGAEVKIPE